MGSKSNHASAGTSGPLKRKRDTAPGQTPSSSQYYFAKYLTSPELLDLEVRVLLIPTCAFSSQIVHRSQTHISADSSFSSYSSSYTTCSPSPRPRRRHGRHRGTARSKSSSRSTTRAQRGRRRRLRAPRRSCARRRLRGARSRTRYMRSSSARRTGSSGRTSCARRLIVRRGVRRSRTGWGRREGWGWRRRRRG